MQLKAVTFSSFAVPGVQSDEIEDLRGVSQRNNARDFITGVLMFNGAAFVHAIEGPVGAVDGLVMRIASDRRHCEMEIRDERLLSKRIFSAWTMGYVRTDGGWLEGQYAIAEALGRDMPDPIRELLMSMATTLPFE